MANPGEMIYIAVDELEGHFGPSKTDALARDSEAHFLEQLVEVAYEAAWNRNIKAVFISGPTSSGKTTFSQRLGSAIHLFGRKTVTISLDDYYHKTVRTYDDLGRADLESISTIDVDLMVDHFQKLLDGEEVGIPTYDFASRSRIFVDEKKIKLNDDMVLIVEGLHGLSGEVIGRLPKDEVLGVFVCPWATLVDDKTLLEAWQIRQFRRVLRDSHSRGTSPLATLDYWPVIALSESILFEDYLHRADYFVNTVIPYEFFVIGPLAAKALRKDLDKMKKSGEKPRSPMTESGHFADLTLAIENAQYLIDVGERLPALDPSFVPPMSILNEFIN